VQQRQVVVVGGVRQLRHLSQLLELREFGQRALLQQARGLAVELEAQS
jgi:hypothetical protein